MTAAGAGKQLARTSFGDIAYLCAGDEAAPPVLFVHGIPTSGYLWREVIAALGARFRCYAPDLMGLGDTLCPVDGAYDMGAQAAMLVELMGTLGHERFALVCHDQGGAAAQIIAAEQPQRVTCWVITNCVCYDNWPVPVIKRLQAMARLPWVSEVLARSGVSEWMETTTRLSSFRRGVYDPRSLTDEAIREYLRPMRASREGRQRFRAFLLAGDPRFTLQAVAGLRRFDAPTAVLWAADDRFLSPSWGRTLCDDIPGAGRLELVAFCGHFWQEERPAPFVALMRAFLSEHLLAAPG